MDNNIKDAVLWAMRRMENKPSENTQNQYIKAEKRLINEVRNGILPSASKKRNTRSFKRSAIRYLIARRILQNFNGDKPDKALISELYGIVKKINLDAIEAQKDYVAGKSFPNTQVRDTKRDSVLSDEDWRVDFINFASKSKFIDYIKIMAACGCRPADIQNGVFVEQNGQTTIFTINGAKCKEGSKEKNNGTGQEFRILTFDSNHPLMKMISPGKYQAKAKGISDSTAHFGKKFPESKEDNPVSAYTFRHAAATDFKASGFSAEEISAALGHQSTRTKSKYGYSGKGSVNLKLLSVKATSEVRDIPKKPRFKNKSF